MKVITKTLVAFMLVVASSLIVLAQAEGSGVVVLKCSWEKERIRPRASLTSLASREELIQQSNRQQELAAARTAGDKGKVTRLETQTQNHQTATTQASQTELPRDGYKYRVTLRNDGVKTIKSIDWDYLFIDPLTQQELAHHQFTSDETIKSGKSKEVSVLYLVPPVKTIRVDTLNKKDPARISEQVVVARIQYADGSSWKRP